MQYIGVGLLSIIMLGAISCDTVSSEKMYRLGGLACSDTIAAEVGLKILKDGGNAIDAACATAFALAVTYPQAGNIGGGGFALIYMADSPQVHFIDFRETAPAAASAEVYLDNQGEVDRDKALMGPLSAGTPGTVAGLYEMHRRFGRSNWSDLVRPARFLADTGFSVGQGLSESLDEEGENLRKFKSTEDIFFPDGLAPRPGQRLTQPDLALALNLIEQKGRDGFYLGETAAAIEQFCAGTGGLITKIDLEKYRSVWRQPVHFKFRQLDIYTAGLPSSGGAVMGQILKILDEYELERYTADSPEYIHLFSEASRRAFADRSEYLGDPDFTEDLTDRLLDDSYIASRTQSIDLERASSSADILPGMPMGRHESDQTTHLVVTDAEGNIVSLTYTVNSWFGCKAIVPGYGFFLNNEMDDFAILPDAPNAFGLTGSQANSVEPGKRMLSSMTPTLVFKSRQPFMALGSPGGSKIITAVTQAIINYHVFEMTLTESVTSPRFHHQWLPDKLYLEQGGYDIQTVQKLINMGHAVTDRTPYAEVMALGFTDDGGFIIPAADPRRSGGCATGY
jgi:gamma-glutamyltranspeptidase/glutathione hydrolase